MKAVLVTGGNGFIGRYVVEELIDRSYEVTVLDTRDRSPEPGARMVLGDIRDATSVTEAVAHADGVIHLAGVLGTQETINNPRPAAETNILGGLNVFEACAQYGVPLVNIAVGNHWMNNTYSITKSTMERFAAMLNQYRGTRIQVLRALNAYGPRQLAAAPFGPSKVRKIMPSFICRALAGMPIEVYGDGSQVMDMIYVADVATSLVTALEHTAADGPVGILEAGSGRPTTVNQIAHLVAEAVADSTHSPAVPVVHLPMRPGEDEHSIVLGKPETLLEIGVDLDDFAGLEEGVSFTVDYYAHLLRDAA
jgi:UDP-glucose 4-epimerase